MTKIKRHQVDCLSLELLEYTVRPQPQEHGAMAAARDDDKQERQAKPFHTIQAPNVPNNQQENARPIT